MKDEKERVRIATYTIPIKLLEQLDAYIKTIALTPSKSKVVSIALEKFLKTV